MPSEVTATAAIVAFVLMLVIAAGFMLLANAAITLQESISKTITQVYASEKQAVFILSGYRSNATTAYINVTVKGTPLTPLTKSEIIVKYIDNSTGSTVTTVLHYGEVPGWDIVHIFNGALTRSVKEGDYLIPGEICEAAIYLPTNSSLSSPLITVFVSPEGSSSIYSIGGG